MPIARRGDVRYELALYKVVAAPGARASGLRWLRLDAWPLAAGETKRQAGNDLRRLAGDGLIVWDEQLEVC